MVTIRYAEGKGWYDARVEARAPIPMDPATRRAALRAGDLRGAEGVPRGRRRRRRCSARTPTPRRFAESAAADGDAAAAARSCSSSSLRAAHRRSTGTGSRPSAEGSLYLRPFMYASEVFLGVRPALGVPLPGHRLAGRRLLHAAASSRSRSGSPPDYTRAAPGGTGAAKCGGNYAASLLAQAEAIEHGCDQVVFLDAVRAQVRRRARRHERLLRATTTARWSRRR